MEREANSIGSGKDVSTTIFSTVEDYGRALGQLEEAISLLATKTERVRNGALADMADEASVGPANHIGSDLAIEIKTNNVSLIEKTSRLLSIAYSLDL